MKNLWIDLLNAWRIWIDLWVEWVVKSIQGSLWDSLESIKVIHLWWCLWEKFDITWSCCIVEIFIKWHERHYSLMIDNWASLWVAKINNLKLFYDPSAIDAIILTHAHNDHVWNLPSIFKHIRKYNDWVEKYNNSLETKYKNWEITQEQFDNMKQTKLKNNLPIFATSDTCKLTRIQLESWRAIIKRESWFDSIEVRKNTVKSNLKMIKNLARQSWIEYDKFISMEKSKRLEIIKSLLKSIPDFMAWERNEFRIETIVDLIQYLNSEWVNTKLDLRKLWTWSEKIVEQIKLWLDILQNIFNQDELNDILRADFEWNWDWLSEIDMLEEFLDKIWFWGSRIENIIKSKLKFNYDINKELREIKSVIATLIWFWIDNLQDLNSFSKGKLSKKDSDLDIYQLRRDFEYFNNFFPNETPLWVFIKWWFVDKKLNRNKRLICAQEKIPDFLDDDTGKFNHEIIENIHKTLWIDLSEIFTRIFDIQSLIGNLLKEWVVSDEHFQNLSDKLETLTNSFKYFTKCEFWKPPSEIMSMSKDKQTEFVAKWLTDKFWYIYDLSWKENELITIINELRNSWIRDLEQLEMKKEQIEKDYLFLKQQFSYLRTVLWEDWVCDLIDNPNIDYDGFITWKLKKNPYFIYDLDETVDFIHTNLKIINRQWIKINDLEQILSYWEGKIFKIMSFLWNIINQFDWNLQNTIWDFIQNPNLIIQRLLERTDFTFSNENLRDYFCTMFECFDRLNIKSKNDFKLKKNKNRQIESSFRKIEREIQRYWITDFEEFMRARNVFEINYKLQNELKQSVKKRISLFYCILNELKSNWINSISYLNTDQETLDEKEKNKLNWWKEKINEMRDLVPFEIPNNLRDLDWKREFFENRLIEIELWQLWIVDMYLESLRSRDLSEKDISVKINNFYEALKFLVNNWINNLEWFKKNQLDFHELRTKYNQFLQIFWDVDIENIDENLIKKKITKLVWSSSLVDRKILYVKDLIWWLVETWNFDIERSLWELVLNNNWNINIKLTQLIKIFGTQYSLKDLSWIDDTGIFDHLTKSSNDVIWLFESKSKIQKCLSQIADLNVNLNIIDDSFYKFFLWNQTSRLVHLLKTIKNRLWVKSIWQLWEKLECKKNIKECLMWTWLVRDLWDDLKYIKYLANKFIRLWIKILKDINAIKSNNLWILNLQIAKFNELKKYLWIDWVDNLPIEIDELKQKISNILWKIEWFVCNKDEKVSEALLHIKKLVDNWINDRSNLKSMEMFFNEIKNQVLLLRQKLNDWEHIWDYDKYKWDIDECLNNLVDVYEYVVSYSEIKTQVLSYILLLRQNWIRSKEDLVDFQQNQLEKKSNLRKIFNLLERIFWKDVDLSALVKRDDLINYIKGCLEKLWFVVDLRWLINIKNKIKTLYWNENEWIEIDWQKIEEIVWWLNWEKIMSDQDIDRIWREIIDRLPFSQEDVWMAINCLRALKYWEEKEIIPWTWIKVCLYPNWHILWACSVVLTVPRWDWENIHETLVFSWDLWRIWSYNTWKHWYLMSTWETQTPQIDWQVSFIQTESTYWDREHTNLELEISRFIDEINSTLKSNWKVFLPVLMLNRAQDVIRMCLLLKSYNIFPRNTEIYVDWFRLDQINEVFIKSKENLTDWKWKTHPIYWDIERLSKLFKKIDWNWHRELVARSNKPTIIISTWWMLQNWSSASSWILNTNLLSDPKNLLWFTCYQWEWTLWRLISEISSWQMKDITDLEDWVASFLNSWKQIKCRVWHFKFSWHWDQNDILQFLEPLIMKLKESWIICIWHWDQDAVECLKNTLLDKIDWSKRIIKAIWLRVVNVFSK